MPYITVPDIPTGNVSAAAPASVVSTLNSTTTLLAGNAVFTGTGENVLAYSSISIQAYSDHASAASGLVVQQSQDGTNWDTQNAYSVSAATAFQQTLNLTGQFIKVTYTNGATPQTVFRLQVIKEIAASPSAGVANQRVSAQAGDFPTNTVADLLTLLTLAGASTDANTVASVMGRLTKIRDLLAATLTVAGTITEANSAAILAKIVTAPALEGGHLATIDTSTAASKTDLDNILTQVTNHTETNSAAIKADADALLKQADTFGGATALTAATTFSGIPTVSQLAANSSVLLSNPGSMATFLAEVNVAAAFVGTLSFYVLEPDNSTLQLVSAYLRNSTTIANNSAISTAVALNQIWIGNVANLKAVYVVCTAFTSGSVSVTLGLSAAPYVSVILNTPAMNLTQVAGATLSSTNPVNVELDRVNGQALAVGSNAVPVLTSAATGYVAAYASNPAALTSSTDYSFKWGASGTTVVNHILIVNNTASPVGFDLDVAATAGSPLIPAAGILFLDVQTTVVHLFQASTANVGGSSAGNIVVKGWL